MNTTTPLRPGLELANGAAVGRDPRSMTTEELTDMGHMPAPILTVIRRHCIDCSGGEAAEVRRCTVTKCPLWPYRMGRNPFTRRTLSEEQREALRARAAAARARRSAPSA